MFEKMYPCTCKTTGRQYRSLCQAWRLGAHKLSVSEHKAVRKAMIAAHKQGVQLATKDDAGQIWQLDK